jgi:hypothetical protein
MATVDNWLGQLKGAAGEADARHKADLKRRLEAEKSAKSTLLHPDDLRGNLDMGRLLQTTLGGKRAITADDLAAFRRNIHTFEQKYTVTEGLTARQIIDMANVKVSGKETDLKRSNREIKNAAVLSFFNGTMRFMTNAGPDSEDTRHHVTVQFMGYVNAVSGAAQNTQDKPLDTVQIAFKLTKERLKFECDCGRHTFWFRYLATIGRWGLGRKELAFPKVRNPGMAGVACKHVLRVMSDIESSIFVAKFIAKALEKAIMQGHAKVNLQQKQKEAELQRQTQRTIKTTEQREADNLKQREARAAKKSASQSKTPPKIVTRASKKPKLPPKNTPEYSIAEKSIIQSLRANGINEAVIQEAIKALREAK